jgi:urocanate hydratase
MIPLNGYLPQGWTSPNGSESASAIPKRSRKSRQASMAVHVRAMLDFHNAASCRPRLRQQHPPGGEGRRGVANAFDFPGFVPAYIRPLFCRGIGPFRWAALSGDPGGHLQDRRQGEGADPRRPHLHNWLDMAQERIQFPGPAGAHLLGRPRRPPPPRPAFNEMVAKGELKAPIVIGRDHLDSGLGRLAQPRDRSDEGRLGRRVRLAAAQRAAQHRQGATWVSLHHGGGVGMGFSQHSGMVIVADGTPKRPRAARARAVERPGHRRHAPRGCGL